MLGRLLARGAGFWPQLLACALVRLLHNAATTAFFIWVIAGGLDAYAGTLLLVTHDRRMLAAVSTTRRLEVSDGRVTER